MTGHKHGSSFVLNAADQAQALAKVVEEALADFGLVGAFQSRSADQREAYIAWIASANGQETQDERIAVMLDELALIDRSTGIGCSFVDRADLQSTHKQEV
jgi:Bacteriocin-protection, YdeI or OmpD-Associated